MGIGTGTMMGPDGAALLMLEGAVEPEEVTDDAAKIRVRVSRKPKADLTYLRQRQRQLRTRYSPEMLHLT